MTAREQWRPVAGWESSYEVSSLGRFRSLRTGQVMRGWLNALGYHRVTLSLDGVRQDALAHRLVCEAFHGPPPTALHEAAHYDGDPSNRRADNLRWATHAENMADKRLHGTHTCGERHSRAKLTLAEVKQIILSSAKQSDLARRFDVTPATICDIKKGRSWQEALLEDVA